MKSMTSNKQMMKKLKITIVKKNNLKNKKKNTKKKKKRLQKMSTTAIKPTMKLKLYQHQPMLQKLDDKLRDNDAKLVCDNVNQCPLDDQLELQPPTTRRAAATKSMKKNKNKSKKKLKKSKSNQVRRRKYAYVSK